LKVNHELILHNFCLDDFIQAQTRAKKFIVSSDIDNSEADKSNRRKKNKKGTQELIEPQIPPPLNSLFGLDLATESRASSSTSQIHTGNLINY
jgi:hypothetical protein